jgi:hypothetical protein
MRGVPSLPELPPPGERPPWADALLETIAAFQELVQQQREQIQALRDEVARLKGQKAKPAIQPSKLNQGEDKPLRAKRVRTPHPPRKPDRTIVLQPDQVPDGSRFKGYDDYTVQELVIHTQITRYRVEKWQAPDGHWITGTLPREAAEGHFGPTLRCFVLYPYYHAQVTEPLIVEQLREWGVSISTGQLHRLLLEGKERFHQEKDAILRVGLRVSKYIHADDTGARHRGKNGYCTHIGNAWFAWFQSTESQSRIHFLQRLRAGHTDYVLRGEALEYMAAQALPKAVLTKLAAVGDQTFADTPAWQAALRQAGVTVERHVRIATEGAWLGSVMAHGVHPELALISDDAGQFKVLRHALCWIHAERVLAKRVGFNEA